MNTLLCKTGISCGRLEGRDRGTALFTAHLKADCEAKEKKKKKALTEQFINCELSALKLFIHY